MAGVMRRVAVIGAAGQLGTDLVRGLEPVAEEVLALSHPMLDVSRAADVQRTLSAHRPDAVINCAAYVRVDDAEVMAEQSMVVNAVGALNVARACEEIGAVCVFISTDYVFDGSKAEPYTEDDSPAPINVYGISKLSGEYCVRVSSQRHYIIRVASLYGEAGSRSKGGNLVETVILRGRNEEPLRAVIDQFISPTYTRDAAAKINELLRRRAPYGIYHVANSGECSWFQFASAVLERAGLRTHLEPISAAQWVTRARRPRRSSLASTRLQAAGLAAMRSWQDGLTAYLEAKGHVKR